MEQLPKIFRCWCEQVQSDEKQLAKRLATCRQLLARDPGTRMSAQTIATGETVSWNTNDQVVNWLPTFSETLVFADENDSKLQLIEDIRSLLTHWRQISPGDEYNSLDDFDKDVVEMYFCRISEDKKSGVDMLSCLYREFPHYYHDVMSKIRQRELDESHHQRASAISTMFGSLLELTGVPRPQWRTTYHVVQWLTSFADAQPFSPNVVDLGSEQKHDQMMNQLRRDPVTAPTVFCQELLHLYAVLDKTRFQIAPQKFVGWCRVTTNLPNLTPEMLYTSARSIYASNPQLFDESYSDTAIRLLQAFREARLQQQRVSRALGLMGKVTVEENKRVDVSSVISGYASPVGVESMQLLHKIQSSDVRWADLEWQTLVSSLFPQDVNHMWTRSSQLMRNYFGRIGGQLGKQ